MLMGGFNNLPLSRLNFGGISPKLMTYMMKSQNVATLEELKQEFQQQAAAYLQQLLVEERNYWQQVVEERLKQIQQNLEDLSSKLKKHVQPLEQKVANIEKAINVVDLRLVAQNMKSNSSSEEVEKRVTAYCPHCDEEALAPVDGVEALRLRLLCRRCKQEFTFPTVD
jgi:hypothetical protein